MSRKQDRHFRLHFYRTTNRKGRTVTRVRLQRENFKPKRVRGLLHKLTNFSDVASGELPSVTRTLNNLKPKTFAGKAALTFTKGAYRTVKFTAKTAVNTALLAESTLLFASDVINPKRQAQLSFTREKKPNGKFRTHFKIYYKDKAYSSRHRGAVRESIDFIRNAEGDVLR